MNKSLKRSLAISLLLVLILIIIILIPGSKVTLNIFSLIIILALIVLVWIRYFQELAQTKKNVLSHDDNGEATQKDSTEVDNSTKTGSVCEKSGVYVCQEHPHRTVEMEEGKRFPPCRGDEKGHSTIWVLQE